MEHMMNHSQPAWRLAALATLLMTGALCLSASRRPPESLKRPNMTALSPRLQALFEKTKIVCFGRFVVEVPDSATAVFGPTHVDYPINYFPGEAEKLAERVTEQLGEVEKDREFLDKDFIEEHPLFGTVVDGDMPGQKMVYGSRDHATYSIHSFIPVSKDLFVQSADGVLSKEHIESLNTAARHLRLRADSEIPSEPGICIDGGFVAWQPEYENVALGIRLKEFPDVHFSIEVKRNPDFLDDAGSLERRLKGAEQDGGSWYSRIVFLRRGARQLGLWHGEEVLAHMPAQDDSSDAHEFHFYSVGALKDAFHPQLDIQLDTGVKDNRTAHSRPSISDEEAVAVWDKLTSSIRVRPTGGKAGAFAAPPSTLLPTPSKTPLGALRASGALCPQTGWWRCADEGAEVLGGRRQYFTAAKALPNVVLPGKPSLLQRFTGERPTFTCSTIWTLSDCDPAPDAACVALPLADAVPLMPPMAGADGERSA
jgi:hypothetical protein